MRLCSMPIIARFQARASHGAREYQNGREAGAESFTSRRRSIGGNPFVVPWLRTGAGRGDGRESKGSAGWLVEEPTPDFIRLMAEQWSLPGPVRGEVGARTERLEHPLPCPSRATMV